MTDQDRICLPVPLFHSFGMIVGISSSIVAGSALMLPNEIFNAKKTLQCIEKYKCTAIYGVPTMFVTEMAEKEFDSIDRSTIKFGIIAGAAMPPELLKRITKVFPLPRLYTCWGKRPLAKTEPLMPDTLYRYDRTQLICDHDARNGSLREADKDSREIVPELCC